MSGAAATRHLGRRLTGLTFGKRGRPVYARIYDKTEHAPDNAVIREVWERAGYEPARHGFQVWRIEFEVRAEFLRQLAADDGHLPSNPGTLLGRHLDEVWAHLLSRWLVLRREGETARVERRPAARWWSALATCRGLNGESFGPVRELSRRAPVPTDCTLYLRQAAGLLVAVGAANGNPSLEDALTCFARWVRDTMGEPGFAEAVAARSERAVPHSGPAGRAGQADPQVGRRRKTFAEVAVAGPKARSFAV
ncbi:hypothetical protein JDY09_00640 [Thermoleophilum album]|uniref:hypothetical protein n=1 Tax=Thermoleophilum album TaxID=29539 RepID=UPI00237CF55C|nr:hypothetical protein [Thermoleophilum album]WDT93804.1 hypothetical protein JDY09_00640 [Thermoleophilum album]